MSKPDDDEDSAPPTPRAVNNRTLYRIISNLQVTVNTRLSQIREAVAGAAEPMPEELANEVSRGLADVGHHFAQSAIAVKGR